MSKIDELKVQFEDEMCDFLFKWNTKFGVETGRWFSEIKCTFEDVENSVIPFIFVRPKLRNAIGLENLDLDLPKPKFKEINIDERAQFLADRNLTENDITDDIKLWTIEE